MKSFSKRVASFTMAAAMVLSLAAVSPVDAEAATAKITKKSSITAGKTYTYNVKNVTKSQYIKVRMSSGVTVKYNNKTVKKNSTKIKGGKTIALKVKAADKVANYKATVKAVIYNKKTNKKVKTLTTQSTVKCTALKVTDVTVASNSGKYLVATFNKTLTKLSVADIEVRKLNTNELKGVEKVELSSDGKSATVTLVGSEDSINNQFVQPNTEYVFTVSQSGAKASTNFTVDAVKAYVTIEAVDAATKTVWYTTPNSKNTNTTVTDGSVSLREEVYSGDFQDLLGRTVTVWYNKNNVATKLATVDETIVYGSFKYVASNTATSYFEDLATGQKYYEQITSGDVNKTQIINLGTNKYFDGADQQIIDYAKLVLYSNGNVRTMVYNRTNTNKLLVTDVKDTVVYSGTKTAMNLKDYLILKDGKTAKIADIQKDDVVFVDSANKFAEIYTSSKTGDLQAVYDGQYKFGDVTYLTEKVKVIKDNAVVPADKDYMKSLFKGGPAVTVYFDRAGQPAFITGKLATVASSTDVVILTDNGKEYNSALNDIIQLKGYNGTETKTYDINVADLTNVRTVVGSSTNVTGASKWVVDGGKTADVTSTETDGTNKTETKKLVTSDFANDIDSDGTVKTYGTTGSDGTNVLSTTDFEKFAAVELTKNDAGKVVGITKKYGFSPSSNLVAGNTQIDGYQISKTTPVYVYNTKNNSVSKMTYADYAGNTNRTDVFLYTGSLGTTRDIDYVVVKDAAPLTAKTITGVVGSVVRVDEKMVSLVVINGMESTEYKTFFNDTIAKKAAVAGDVVTIEVAKDDKTVVNVDKQDTTSASVSVSSDAVNQAQGEFKLANNTPLKVAGTGYTVVLKKTDAQGIVTYEAVAFNELATLKLGNVIKYHKLSSTGYIDAIIIESK